jgi:hypothetical protein
MGRITYPPKAELRLVLVKVAAAAEDMQQEHQTGGRRRKDSNHLMSEIQGVVKLLIFAIARHIVSKSSSSRQSDCSHLLW